MTENQARALASQVLGFVESALESRRKRKPLETEAARMAFNEVRKAISEGRLDGLGEMVIGAAAEMGIDLYAVAANWKKMIEG